MTATFPDDTADRLAGLCTAFLRRPYGVASDDLTGDPIITFDPVLSPAEQTTFNHLLRLARSRVTGITPAEFQALEADIDGLVTFQGIASPTLAQTVLAVKAQSRILKAILRS